ncbi:MAG: nicotinate-nucleotide adenylyltransferase [Eubacteriales bacterium]
MGEKQRKIGILGGSFNPIHYGHLLLAESARDRLGLDEIIFLPAGNNPHKINVDEIDVEHRYNMAKLAIQGNPNFGISRIEMDREGFTYTVETLEVLEQIYHQNDFYFITGADIIFEIDNWKKADQLLRRIKIITTYRPGYEQENLDSRIVELKEYYGAKILKLHTPEMDISSSEIRSRIKHGYSIKYLLPHDVEQYIYDHNLYL